MLKPLYTRLGNLPLRRKLTLIICLAMFLFCIVFTLNLHYLTGQYETDLYEANAQILDNVIADISARMENSGSISDYIISDSQIQQNLLYLNDHGNESRVKTAITKRNIYEALYSYMFSSRYIKSISLILNDNSEITMGNIFPPGNMDMSAINLKVMNLGGRELWVAGAQTGYSLLCVRPVRQLKYLKLRKLAILYITIDMDRMVADSLKDAGYVPDGTDFVITGAGGEQIYPETTERDLSFCSASRDNAYYIVSEGKNKEFIITGTMKTQDWQYFYFRDYNKIFNHITRIKILTFVFTFVFLAIALILTSIILTNILKGLDLLMVKIRNFGQGIEPPQSGFSADGNRLDEIGKLHRTFDDMTRSVKNLRDENYDKQILLKDATIKMLEQQINPHFLYNTLDSINWMAQTRGAEDISAMALALGNLFRAAITGGQELIPLSNELEFLDNYIRIQKIRYRDRLQFSSSVPPCYRQVMIPKLCIQPLVENAIQHAVEYNADACTIVLTVTENADCYLIRVANTGSAFDENMSEKIGQRPPVSKGTGVGLMNIASRIKLIYGGSGKLCFYNDDGTAVVELSIPKTEQLPSHPEGDTAHAQTDDH